MTGIFMGDPRIGHLRNHFIYALKHCCGLKLPHKNNRTEQQIFETIDVEIINSHNAAATTKGNA